jgi:hypothetical protein
MDERSGTVVQSGGPEALHAPGLLASGFTHAFFTRRGGVSLPPWDTLDFAVSTGDAPEHVRENRARAAAALGVEAEALHYLSQVHGIAHRVLTAADRCEDVVREVGDITLSAVSRLACGVRTADCAPVLVADRRSGAVCAIHSGWRGTVQDVVGAGVAALRALVGGPLDACAAIGPHIERCCFEVGGDVAAQLAAASTAGEAVVLRGADGVRPRVDMRPILRAQLEAAGVSPDAIEDVAGCTVCDRPRFFSFRRDGARSGRLLSAIVARA